MPNKSIVSLCCEKCNETLEIISDDIEVEVPKFAEKHPNCQLKGYINSKFFALFSKKSTLKQNVWLN